MTEISQDKLISVLNFLKNQRIFELKFNELIEVVLFEFGLHESLNISEVAVDQELNLEDCAEFCSIGFQLWNPQGMFGENEWERQIQNKCKWVVKDEETQKEIAPVKVEIFISFMFYIASFYKFFSFFWGF